MPQEKRLHLARATQPLPPPADRGPLLHVEDLQERLGRKADGSFRYSPRWIREHVARDRQLKIGRDVAVYESDFYLWLDEQRRAAS